MGPGADIEHGIELVGSQVCIWGDGRIQSGHHSCEPIDEMV
jgi:hypothetical protein